MLDRIIGAFTFRKGIYAEVERDDSFTQNAWLLVVVVALLSQLGSNAGIVSSGGFGTWLLGSLVGAVFDVIGFAVAAFVISWVGRTVFSADTNFNEMVRVLGLAYVWRVVGFLGIISIISVTLTCILAPIAIIAMILGLIAWLIAIKEALDLDWGRTIVTLILGWIALLVVGFIGGLVLGLLGITAAGIGSLFSG